MDGDSAKVPDVPVPAHSAVKGKGPTRRRYQEAFENDQGSSGGDLEEHIVPSPTIIINDGEDFVLKNIVNGVVQSVEEENRKGKGGKSVEEEEEKGCERFLCQVPSCVLTFGSLKEYQNHYNSRHMHSCSICKKSLPSSHILELHVLEIHDTLFSLMAEKKPMYQCFLESCDKKLVNPESRKEHCLAEHNFHKNFQYWDCKPPKQSHKPKSAGNNSGKAKSKSNEQQKEEQLLSEEEMISQEQQVPMVSDEELMNNQRKGGGDSSKQKAMPKHIAFGHAPHRSFRNAYTAATNSKGKDKNKAGADSNIDMKDIADALVSSGN